MKPCLPGLKGGFRAASVFIFEDGDMADMGPLSLDLSGLPRDLSLLWRGAPVLPWVDILVHVGKGVSNSLTAAVADFLFCCYLVVPWVERSGGSESVWIALSCSEEGCWGRAKFSHCLNALELGTTSLAAEGSSGGCCIWLVPGGACEPQSAVPQGWLPHVQKWWAH